MTPEEYLAGAEVPPGDLPLFPYEPVDPWTYAGSEMADLPLVLHTQERQPWVRWTITQKLIAWGKHPANGPMIPDPLERLAAWVEFVSAEVEVAQDPAKAA